MSRARSGTAHTSNRTEYNSQSRDTPSEIRALSPELKMSLYGVRPVFGPSDPDKPTEAEFKEYNNKVREYVSGIPFLLSYLNDEAGERPGAIEVIDPKKMTALQMWRLAQSFGEEMSEWEKHLEKTKDKARDAEISRIQKSATPGPAKNHLKTPLPSKYNGKKGDNAVTFLAACNNYKIMQRDQFQNDRMLIRWALQQMEEDAGPWAVRQMQRLDTETDDFGDPPEELTNWTRFGEYFLTQFDNLGQVERAKAKWKDGMRQKGKAVDYFKEIETLLIRLKYPHNVMMTLNHIQSGLKPHIRTHFIGEEWTSLNQMKATIVPYDSAYWEINKASGVKTKTQYESKATPINQERGKSTTPQVKTEVAKTGGTQRRFLPQEEFDLCRKNKWCFKCKSDGLEIVGSARYHPNHLPQDTTKKSEKKEKTKIATTSGKEKATEQDKESDSDSDCKQSKN